jgi:hypothetical protein
MQNGLASAKGAVGTLVGAAKTSIAEAGDARDTSRAEELPAPAGRTVRAFRERPLFLALAALAVGSLSGLLLPVSHVERERLGPLRRKLVDQVQAATSDVLEAGKAVLAETIESAIDSALHSAQIHGQAVVDAATERARQR